MERTFTQLVDDVEAYTRRYRIYHEKLRDAIEHAADELNLPPLDKSLVVHEVAVRMGAQGARKAHYMPAPFHKLRSYIWRRIMAKMGSRRLWWPRFKRKHHDQRQTEFDFGAR